MPIPVYLSLGSNLGDRIAALRTALILISELPDTEIVKCSRVYNTEPAIADDEEQPVYANMVALIETELSAEELLAHVNMIESDLGRVRLYPNSPRTLDIDILLFGDEQRSEDLLTIPHPEMLKRDFVMTPLLEIAPDGLTLPDGTPLTKDHVETGACLDVIGIINLPS